ncbi:MAG: DUF624 domain-containing protein [Anaerolineae bacterium]|mgnify:CR=1 FL=1
MKNALRVVRAAIVDLWDSVFLVVFCSLVWLFLVLLIIPGPPATLALFDMADRIARREHLLEFRDYLRAVWQRFGVGWRWGAVNLLVVAVVLIDIRVVPRMVSPTVAVYLQLFFTMALALWIVVNWYALAFLFQQKEASLRQALRNGVVLLLQNPLFTLVLVVITAVLIGLSLVLVIVNLLFGPMLVALISTHAVLNRLEPLRAPPA